MDAEAIAGLASTGVVGLAGIAAAFFAPTFSQRTIERRRELREFRRAKRLVLHELRFNVSVLKLARVEIESGERKTAGRRALTAAAWKSQGSTLATAVEDETWRRLSTAYGVIETWSQGEWPPETPGESPVTAITLALTSVETAMEKLGDAEPLKD